MSGARKERAREALRVAGFTPEDPDNPDGRWIRLGHDGAARIMERADVHQDSEGGSFTVFWPGGEERITLDLPADKDSIKRVVDAILHVQRRTREHAWEGPDDGLAEELEG